MVSLILFVNPPMNCWTAQTGALIIFLVMPVSMSLITPPIALVTLDVKHSMPLKSLPTGPIKLLWNDLILLIAILASGFVAKRKSDSFDIPPSINLTRLSCRALEILPINVLEAEPIDLVSFCNSPGRFVVKSATLLTLLK